MTEQQLKNLLSEMSLQEKVMQLVQLPGGAYDSSASQTGVSAETVTPAALQLAGSTLSIYGADLLRGLQEKYIANHPHHIPLLFMLDVVHGHRTVFPCPLGQGASFDPDTVEKAAAVQAAESAADGIHVTFSPMADLCRDARWGRVMESTGEDALLNSRLSAAMVRGYQGQHLDDGEHVASCVKHFAAYGGAEAGRDYQNVELSEHTLREKYLPAYQAAVRAGAALVMSSFNTWDGIPASGSQALMNRILRGETGFDGVLISDYGAIREMIPHSYAEDEADAARLAMAATLDIDMCSGCYSGYLQQLVESGVVPESVVDQAVLRVLRLKNDLGLFENPYRGISAEKAAAVHNSAETRALARKAVARSLVLLENKKEVLPLSGSKIAFIGPYADSRDLQSSWAVSFGSSEDTVSVFDGAREAFRNSAVEIRCAQGCKMMDNHTVFNYTIYEEEGWEESSRALLAEAEETAAWADTVVLCLGEYRLMTGESTSRTRLTLPDTQLNLLRRISALGKPLVTLVFGGRPLELAEVRGLTDALLFCWLPGTEGGNGILDVLTGIVPPSGKLPMSFPRTVGQEPLHYDQYPTGRPKPPTGTGPFTSRYLDCENTALYPFGYGLTYGNPKLSPVRLSSAELRKGQKITASVEVVNPGSRVLEDVLQLYICDLKGSRVRPVRELRDFRRITLSPGGRCEVSFEIDESMLRFWTADCRWASEPGRFRLWIGLSSDTENAAEFTLV